MPITSAGSGAAGGGPEIELTAQNAAQVLQNPGAVLVQVGTLSEAVSKKIARLRAAASGRLPLVKLDCQVLPQVCNALQIRTTPAVLLMARGQVVGALENDLSPQAATGFVERTAQALGLKVDLAEGASEQLAEAEEAEWSNPRAAEEIFNQMSSAADMQVDARVRAAAGRGRCALRLGGRLEEARSIHDELVNAGHGGTPEAKQLAAMLWLDERRASGAAPVDALRAAAEAAPTDADAAQALAVALFWGGQEGEAVEAGLKLLRRKRSDEAKKLVLMLVEALGPQHPKHTSARRAFSSALFL